MKAITHRFVTSPLGLAEEHQFRPFFAKVFGVPTLHICDKNLAEKVLIDMSDKLSGKAGNRTVAQALFGSSLLYDDGPSHARLRDQLSDIFSIRVQTVEQVSREITLSIAHQYRARAPMRALDFFRCLAVSLTCRHFLDIIPDFGECEWLSRKIDELGIGLYASSQSTHPRSRFQRANAARSEIDAFLIRRFPTTFGRQLEAKGLGERQILDQAVTLLFAGVDTSSVTMTMAINELQRLGETQHSAVAIKTAITTSLREYPPVYFIPRGALEDVQLGDHVVRKGWNVNVMVHAVHHQPSDGTAAPAYLAFGLGKKRCPGEAFALLSSRSALTTLLDTFFTELSGGDMSKLAFMPGLRPTASPFLGLGLRTNFVGE